ncbi:LacI family DNA-binding transcriptional regulator [Cohnella cholangitidis]|uniref:LacI family transcriptional regulator n=1 Tax=Cohnella cholangitidis TaxID=2598458 RepID=A0A7G5C3R0_9BACL|nr:LacI family DNA-binding transcriptional regulator [Cohnella cholangitidis]QMV43844.1 LacI family transcriptional regulator [Cohnella cholangitidis]
MNIYDISRLAGVSRKTVQRVLNNAPNVKPETQAKIQKIMEEHHFEPSAAARKLSSSKPTTIAVFIVQNQERYKLYTDDLFYSAVIGGIVSYSNSRNYNVLVSIMDISDTDQLLSLYKQKSIDSGIIISWSNVQFIVDKVTEAGFSIGVFDQNNLHPGTMDIPFPYLDNRTSAYEAGQYLLDLGYTRLGIVTGDMAIPASQERLDGFLAAVRDRGLSVEKDHIYYGQFIEKSGYDAVERWVRSNDLPEAIFCSNDLMAYGAIQASIRLGVSVPERLSIIGFDDLLISQYTHPPLTTMRVPRVEMAVSITERIIDLMEGKAGNAMPSPTFRAALVERSSCRNAIN